MGFTDDDGRLEGDGKCENLKFLRIATLHSGLLSIFQVGRSSKRANKRMHQGWAKYGEKWGGDEQTKEEKGVVVGRKGTACSQYQTFVFIFSHSLAFAFSLRAFENERLLRRLEDCVIETLR